MNKNLNKDELNTVLNHSELEKKWQETWKKEKLFEPEINSKKPAFYIQAAYPYPSGAMHIGHARTYSITDIIAKYHLMKGFNVLMPIGWHVSGTPVIAEVEALKRKDKKTIKKFTETFRIPEEDLKYLMEAESYVEYMVNKAEYGYKQGFKILGLGIDWRRELKTIDYQYNKFIQWQYSKLKKKNYLVKGRYPVRYCPNDKTPVGDHDLKEGEGIGIIEFTFLKFLIESSKKKYLIAATLRPETVFGQTNLWVNPEEEYSLIEVNNEEWILSKQAVEKLRYQIKGIKEKGLIKGRELLLKKVIAPGINKKIPVLPALFLDSNIGSGIVTSVPSDAPVDFIALKELQEKKELSEKYNLDFNEIKEIKVIPIIKTKKFGENASKIIIKELNIKNQLEKEKLEKAKDLAYKEGYFKGIMNENCKEYNGLQVKKAKELIKNKLIKEGKALPFFELEGKAVCRCGASIVVQVLDDQWFIKYSDRTWKNESSKTLAKMNIVPELFRKQYENSFEWLEDKPCTRSKGLGTRFPWDETKIIEPLGDSTIYMAYFTISNLIKEIKAEKLNNQVFDFIFLGKGNAIELSKKTGIKTELLERMQKEFDYWYPLAFNSSAIELIPNHMSFSIFHHTAIFPENKRQKGTLNLGMLVLEGKKMSSSKGNVILINDICKEIGADNVRLFLMNFVEPWEEMNWQKKDVETGLKTMNYFMNSLYSKAKRNCNASELKKEKLKGINKWLYTKFNERINNYLESMEKLELRKAVQELTFKFFNDLRWFERRKLNEDEEVKALEKYITSNWVKCIAPFMPHTAEEFWRNALKHKESIFQTMLPEKKQLSKEAVFEEEFLKKLLQDINKIKDLAGIKKLKKAVIIIASNWKKIALKKIIERLEKPDFKKAITEIMLIEDVRKNPKIAQRMAKEFSEKIFELKDIKIINERKVIENAKDFLEKELDITIEIQEEAQSKNKKAGNALPLKPAIILE